MINKQWHPIFLAALREALKDAPPGEIEIEPEVALSSKPLDVDFVVVKKNKETKLSHPMAKIFKHYNLFEYKSPADHLEANDFDKGLALAFLYKALKHPGLNTLDEFTFTYVSSGYPRAMLNMLSLRNLQVSEKTPVTGIYNITGWAFPMQIVVLNELADPETTYMFSAFLTGNKRHHMPLLPIIFRKHLKEPANHNLRELINFMLKHDLALTKEIKEVFKLTYWMTPAEKEQERKEWCELLSSELFLTHPFTRKWTEELRSKGREEGHEEGREEGHEEGQKNLICNFLEAKFGSESLGLQKLVREIASLALLSEMATQLFFADSWQDAQKIIQEMQETSLSK